MGIYRNRIRYLAKSIKFMYIFPLFVARLMKRGLKLKAYFLAKCALGFAKFHSQNTHLNVSSVLIFESAVKNLLPTVDICKRVVSGSVLFLPCPLKPNKNIKLALTWLISSAVKSHSVRYCYALALGNSIYDTYMFLGFALESRSLHYRLVRKNRFYLQKSTIRILIA